MARLTRDTAKRSIGDLFADLFRDMAVDAVIEVTRSGSLPPGGLAAMVKIEITKQLPKKPKKATPQKKKPPERISDSDANVPGQPEADVASGDQHRRGKAGKKPAAS